MKMAEQQLLRDPSKEPTAAVIAEGLGDAGAAYNKFTEEAERHNIRVEWHYYNDSKAWLGKALYYRITSRGTQKEITAFWISIWDGFFKVSLFIPEKYRADALKLSLSDSMKKKIEDSTQIGKMKIFPLIFDLRSDESYDEIFTLIDFKKELK